MDLFSNFPTTAYTFLQLGTGGVRGNSVVTETAAAGIFKLRRGLVTSDGVENTTSTATLHIKPSEAFISTVEGNLVGNGVRVAGKEYRIVGMTEGKGGMAFDVIEHYTLSLQEEALA